MAYKITNNLQKNIKMMEDLRMEALVKNNVVAKFLLTEPKILKLMFPKIPKDQLK